MDYGLALKYSPDGSHKVYKEDPRKAHDGTIEFTSTDAHKGVGMSPVFHIGASSNIKQNVVYSQNKSLSDCLKLHRF